MAHAHDLMHLSAWKADAHPDSPEWRVTIPRPGEVHFEGPVQGTAAWDGWRLQYQRAGYAEATLLPGDVPLRLNDFVVQQLRRTHHRGNGLDTPETAYTRDNAKRVLATHGVRPETLEASAFRNNLGHDGHGRLATVGVWVSAPGEDRALLLASSVLDALAHAQMTGARHVRYLAVPSHQGKDAPMTDAQRLAVSRFIASMPVRTIVGLAFGRDGLGARRADEVRALTSGMELQEHRPALGRSWGEALRRTERDFVRAQAQERRVPLRAAGLER